MHSKHYIGVKQVQAWPEEKDGQQGYGVMYPDGYVSWSPKEAFEKAYFPMGDDPTKVSQEMVDAFTKEDVFRFGEKTTLVKAKALTGFALIETSSCVDPENYDPETGRKICAERIESKIWEMLGFVLQWARAGLIR